MFHRSTTRPIVLALLVLSIVVPCAADSPRQLALVPNETAPHLRGKDLEGRWVDVRWDGVKLTIVNFWATWCRPCAVEMPKLQQLYERHRERGLEVVGVSKDNPHDGLGSVAAYVIHVGVSYPILTGGDRISRAWGGVGTLPTTFLIDHEGTVLRRYVGGTEAVLEALTTDVENYLDGRPLGDPYFPEVEPEEGS